MNTTPSPQTPNNDAGQMSIEQALAIAHGHWNAGHASQAEALCQKVLAVWPGNPDALHLLGLMAHNWNNLDLAIDYLRKACQSPQAPSVYFSNLAEMCRQKQLLDEGESMARRAVALDNNLVGAWNNLGIILQEKGKLEEALLCLQRVIAKQPAYAEAHNNLGNTFRKLGQLGKAQIAYKKALELAPNYAEAHSNLSNLFKEFGQYDNALASAKHAIEINPRFADAYINASAAEMARLRHEEALRWVNALLTFAPTHGLALATKATALCKLDHTEEALQYAEQAVIANPEKSDTHNALGQALQAVGRYDEALKAYEDAAKCLSSTPEQAWINKGQLLVEINRLDEAREAYAEALKINPKSASTLFNAADIKKFSEGDRDIDRMNELLARKQELGVNDQMCLHFGLGKAYMDTGDNKRAFDSLARGNRMKRDSISYDANATDHWLESIAEAFPADLFKNRNPKNETPSDMPIFIVGMPRSGTTLVEHVLASHPDIEGAGELSTLSRILTTQNIAYPQAVSAILKNGEAERIGQMYLSHIEKLAEGHKRVVDKMPANFLYAGFIALVLPNARIIHSRRNAADTCLSCYTKLFTAEQNFSYDLAELGQFYCAYTKLMDHWRKVLPADRFIEVDYEAVVEDLESQAKRLIAFCGLPWDEACLNFHTSRRPVRTASAHQVRQPLYKGSVGRWKTYEAYLGPLLSALGVS